VGYERRLIDDVVAELRGLSLSGPRAEIGLRTALAGTLSLVVALALNLDNPW
jgi:hypothetical protein